VGNLTMSFRSIRNSMYSVGCHAHNLLRYVQTVHSESTGSSVEAHLPSWNLRLHLNLDLHCSYTCHWSDGCYRTWKKKTLCI